VADRPDQETRPAAAEPEDAPPDGSKEREPNGGGLSLRTLEVAVTIRSADLTPVGRGFALPREFTINATVEWPYISDRLCVEILAEVVDRSGSTGVPDRTIIAKEVLVKHGGNGVSSTDMRRVPIRDVLGHGVMKSLLVLDFGKDESVKLVGAASSPEKTALVKSLIGYDPEVGE